MFDPEILPRLEELLRDRIANGSPPIGSVARELGLSIRTLQRRLGERGLAYRDVVASVRRRLAEAYLLETTIPIGQIALRLGYSELSAFDRAFRSWHGVSPGRFRRDGGKLDPV